MSLLIGEILVLLTVSKNVETYYGQLPVIIDEILQSQTLVTRPITNIHVEDT
jgi:hypothetical protein